jgi:hypothetical protein
VAIRLANFVSISILSASSRLLPKAMLAGSPGAEDEDTSEQQDDPQPTPLSGLRRLGWDGGREVRVWRMTASPPGAGAIVGMGASSVGIWSAIKGAVLLQDHADASFAVLHGPLIPAPGVAAAGSEYTYVATITWLPGAVLAAMPGRGCLPCNWLALKISSAGAFARGTVMDGQPRPSEETPAVQSSCPAVMYPQSQAPRAMALRRAAAG